jgi:hypothetical protein
LKSKFLAKGLSFAFNSTTGGGRSRKIAGNRGRIDMNRDRFPPPQCDSRVNLSGETASTIFAQ